MTAPSVVPGRPMPPTLADVRRVLDEFADDEDRYAFSGYDDSAEVIRWLSARFAELPSLDVLAVPSRDAGGADQ